MSVFASDWEIEAVPEESGVRRGRPGSAHCRRCGGYCKEGETLCSGCVDGTRRQRRGFCDPDALRSCVRCGEVHPRSEFQYVITAGRRRLYCTTCAAIPRKPAPCCDCAGLPWRRERPACLACGEQYEREPDVELDHERRLPGALARVLGA
jgi:hypothetical protein